jgi:hypothetical protein
LGKSLYKKTHAFVKIITNIYIMGFGIAQLSLITRLDNQGNETLLFSKMSRPALENTMPPIQ